MGNQPPQQRVQEVSGPFTNRKKAMKKMNVSKRHIDSCQAALLSSQAHIDGTATINQWTAEKEK